MDKELSAVLKSLGKAAEQDPSQLLEIWRMHKIERWPRRCEAYRLVGEWVLKLGNPFLAFDILEEGLNYWPHDVRLLQLKALALARSSVTHDANDILARLYQQGRRDEETVGLLARTHKDLASQTKEPVEHETHLRQAFTLYLEDYRLTGGWRAGGSRELGQNLLTETHCGVRGHVNSKFLSSQVAIKGYRQSTCKQEDHMKGKSSGLTRRAFLKSAAALTAAPCIIPATALGGEGRTAPSERIVMGGIGIGGRGSYDLRQLIAWSEVQFVADSDPRAERRANAKALIDKHYNNEDCKLYIDFREMLAREDIDAVLIATGDRWHATASILAMRAGKDVYCEKPCSISIAEARALADTERRCGRVYQAGTQRRSEESFVFVMELARTGRLGKLHTLTAHIVHGLSQHKWFPPEPEPPRDVFDWDLYLGPAPWRPYNKAYLGWHWHYDMHGGGIPEWGSHTFDMCQWANGTDNTGPVEFEYPNNDTGEGLVAQYANGVKLVLKGGPAFPGSCGVGFTGSEGWAECSDGQPATFEPASLGGERSKVIKEYEDRTGRPFDHWREFIDCILSRRRTVAPAETACRSVSICHVANICMELKRNVKWDQAKEEFIGDADANRLRSRPMRAPWQV